MSFGDPHKGLLAAMIEVVNYNGADQYSTVADVTAELKRRGWWKGE